MLALDGCDVDAMLSTDGPISTDEWRALLSTWQVFARPAQLRPVGCKRWWNRQCGRGEGKTRSAAEYTLDVMEDWGPLFVGGISGRTITDTQQTLIYGTAGLMVCAESRGYKLDHRKTDTKLWHPSGAEIRTYGGDKAAAMRGFDGNFFWADELAFWQAPDETFKALNKAVRRRAPYPGAHGIITSTPRRRGSVSRLLAGRVDVLTTGGSSYDNLRNFDDEALSSFEADSKPGTSEHAEEVLGLLLDDGAAFSQTVIDRQRAVILPSLEMRQVVIGYDPAVTSGPESDEHGIIPVSLGGPHSIPHLYVLDDCSVQGVRPEDAVLVVLQKAQMYRGLFGCPVRIVVEVNQGGELWEYTFANIARQHHLPCPEILTVRASDAKVERADNANTYYEMGYVHHVGKLPELERQMTSWMPTLKKSPDRMDAVVHAINTLTNEHHLPPPSAGLDED